MTLIRWNPTGNLFNVHSQLDQMFNELMSGTTPVALGNGYQSLLPVDIRRTDKELVVEASVPGYKPEEVNVTFDNGTLTIDAERNQETEQKGEKYVRNERYVGRLFRQISLGDDVDGDKAQASFENGVLTVTVPLVIKPEPKKIPVSAR